MSAVAAPLKKKRSLAFVSVRQPRHESGEPPASVIASGAARGPQRPWLRCIGTGAILEGHLFFFFKQKTAYEIRPRDWSSDVCSSDLNNVTVAGVPAKIVGDAPC